MSIKHAKWKLKRVKVIFDHAEWKILSTLVALWLSHYFGSKAKCTLD